MQKKDTLQKTIFISGIILLAALSRVVPHTFNFSPIGAICLFGAAYFSNRILAVLVPLAAVFISDLVINNFIYKPTGGFVFLYDGFYWPYATFAAIAILGMFTLKKINIKTVIFSSLGASVLFFLVTNFACWPGSSSIYTQDFTGLMTCYAAGIPYFGATILGDLFYCGVLFTAAEMAHSRFKFLQTSRA